MSNNKRWLGRCKHILDLSSFDVFVIHGPNLPTISHLRLSWLRSRARTTAMAYAGLERGNLYLYALGIPLMSRRVHQLDRLEQQRDELCAGMV